MEQLTGIVVTGIVAGVGAFFGAYLKKKAEILAINENFKKLVADQKVMTEATKGIEARISIGVWARQQRWDVQKTALLESLKELATAETCLYGLVYIFRDTRDHPQGSAERREEAREKYADAINNFRRTQLAMEIVCGTAIGTRFQEIDNILGRTLHGARRGDFGEIWSQLCPALEAAKRELGKTIRSQLEFDPQLGGGELSLSTQITPLSSES
jgi:hypothetical protein